VLSATPSSEKWLAQSKSSYMRRPGPVVRVTIGEPSGFVRGSGSGDQCIDAGDLRRCQRPVAERACLFLGLFRCPDTAERDCPVRACPDICQRALDQGAPAGAELFANLSQSLPPARHAGLGEVVPIWRLPTDITGCKLIRRTVLAGEEPHRKRATSEYGKVMSLAARQRIFVGAEDVQLLLHGNASGAYGEDVYDTRGLVGRPVAADLPFCGELVENLDVRVASSNTSPTFVAITTSSRNGATASPRTRSAWPQP
jgi:hypothetical protein